jgi:glycosyltransferase involved in cell wall biosynthesis
MGKISLIITTFNRPQVLVRAVESAKRAGQSIEVIVVDDASTDETAGVCRALQGIKYVRAQRNQGVAGARNLGLLESAGEYIAFLDDDDLRLPGSLDHQLSLLEAAPDAGFVASAVLLADQHSIPTGEVSVPRSPGGDVFWDALGLKLFLLPASVLVRKSCFFEVGLFNQRIPGIDDWDMWTRIAEVRPVVVDDLPVSIYRCATPQSGQGSSALARHLMAAVKHQKRLFNLPRVKESPTHLRRAVRAKTKRRVSDTLIWHAAEQLPRGAFRFAAANVLAAFRLCPLRALRPTHFEVFWRSATARLQKRFHLTGETNIG